MAPLRPNSTLSAATPSDGTPFGGTAPSIASSGTTIIEAEHFNDGGEGVAYHTVNTSNIFNSSYRSGAVGVDDLAGASNGHLVGWIKAGDWLKYTINVPGAGNYTLGIRTASVGLGGLFHVELDGANVTGTLSAPDTGGWLNWQIVASGPIAFGAGTHVLKVVFDTSQQSNGYIANFDSLTLTAIVLPSGDGTPFGGTAPTIAAIGTTPIECENFNDGGEGVAYHTAFSANIFGSSYRTGGVGVFDTSSASNGHLIGWIKAGDWLKYTINVAETKSYRLAANVASVGAGGLFHIEIDGINVSGSLTAPDTGDWLAWQTVDGGSTLISAGAHVLRLVFDASQQSNGYIANFDFLTLTGSAPPPPPAPPPIIAPPTPVAGAKVAVSLSAGGTARVAALSVLPLSRENLAVRGTLVSTGTTSTGVRLRSRHLLALPAGAQSLRAAVMDSNGMWSEWGPAVSWTPGSFTAGATIGSIGSGMSEDLYLDEPDVDFPDLSIGSGTMAVTKTLVAKGFFDEARRAKWTVQRNPIGMQQDWTLTRAGFHVVFNNLDEDQMLLLQRFWRALNGPWRPFWFEYKDADSIQRYVVRFKDPSLVAKLFAVNYSSCTFQLIELLPMGAGGNV